MTIGKDNNLLWNDIKNIYNILNEARPTFGFTAVTVPEKTNEKIVPTESNSLKSIIQAMTSQRHLVSVADTSAIPIINSGEIITNNSFSLLEEKVNTIKNTCAFDATNFSGFFSGNFGFFCGFTPIGTNFSSFFSSNNSFFPGGLSTFNPGGTFKTFNANVK